MRIVRIILITLSIAFALCLLVILAPWFLKSQYLRFVDKDQKYHSQVARACDLLLEQHPLGTNEVVHLSGDDASVPSIIRDLHPSTVTITSNCVHVMVGVREFGLCWEAKDGNSNSWALNVYAEGSAKALYVEKK